MTLMSTSWTKSGLLLFHTILYKQKQALQKNLPPATKAKSSAVNKFTQGASLISPLASRLYGWSLRNGLLDFFSTTGPKGAMGFNRRALNFCWASMTWLTGLDLRQSTTFFVEDSEQPRCWESFWNFWTATSWRAQGFRTVPLWEYPWWKRPEKIWNCSLYATYYWKIVCMLSHLRKSPTWVS